mmetsp:Transcript_33869/g.98445  ORF Transcript_33869/g.98445 Transcript_33869/m.98445 type:complete len:104 (+) Transcript_33869:1-312(+)
METTGGDVMVMMMIDVLESFAETYKTRSEEARAIADKTGQSNNSNEMWTEIGNKKVMTTGIGTKRMSDAVSPVGIKMESLIFEAQIATIRDEEIVTTLGLRAT